MRECRRIRDWMEVPGRFLPGARNAITDVGGVTVGQYTLETERAHTGVTVIRQHPGNVYRFTTPCGVYVGNGFGKMVGGMQVAELGECETMIGLTNTLSLPQLVQGLLDYHTAENPEAHSINVLAGETNDGGVNDIRAFFIRPQHVRLAIDALGAEVAEGCVGAGAGTVCFGYKAGIGTSSRIVPGSSLGEAKDYTVGVLIQSNFGGNLNVYGYQLPYKPLPKKDLDGSCMIVVATDAPLDARQLTRIAKRAVIGMASTGSFLSNGSGDFAIAFSNAEQNLRNRKRPHLSSWELLRDTQLDPLFEATAEAAREAVYNSLTMARDAIGVDGQPVPAFDITQYADLIPLKK